MNKNIEKIMILVMATIGLFSNDNTLLYMIFGVLAMIYLEILDKEDK